MTTDGIQNRFSRAQIAEALEISGNQILQYQERGLLAERPAKAQDIAYNSLDIARLRFILRCEAAGYQGKDIIDFIGTVNKGANIKEQLKASLVHAHQKFSYVNAQKRKADILEKVNLQADADLIQKYIDEMKGILDNPLKSPIEMPAVKRSLQPTGQPERPSRFKSESKMATRLEPKEERAKKSEPEPSRPPRLKVGLERSYRLNAEPKQPSRPARRAAAQKDRNKFIDSSAVGAGYSQRMPHPPIDDYVDYSGTIRPKSSAAWKQTLATFLLLSVLSLAGYVYYILKYQTPSFDSLTETLGEPLSAEDTTINQEEEKEPDTPKKLESESIEPVTKNRMEHKTNLTATDESLEEIESASKSKSLNSNDQVAVNLDNNSIQTDKASPAAKPADEAAPRPFSTSGTDMTQSNHTKSELSTTTTDSKTEQTESTDQSLSGTAMKDLDDLLAEKQRFRQPSTDVYAIAERPEVAVYDFKLFYQRSRKILIAKFKMARIRPQRNLIQGRLFVVFKPRQSVQSLKFFSVPDARISDGIPAEPLKGIEFSFSESTKVQSVRTIYVHNPSQFDIATVFVFSNAGELVLKKDFTVNITEY